ncbi:MAG: TlpA family protein disulfide reductase [Bacteroidetes bacterium]|nr:MAG: TlpA family protein disulfide reductase [Bacteroidota bacterium]
MESKKPEKKKTLIGRIADIAFYVIIGGFILYKLYNMNPPVKPDEYARDFSAINIMNNNLIRLSDYSNKVILLNFWATWCPPCRKEIPDLIRLQDEMQNKIQIIGISVDKEPRNKVLEFAKNRAINYPVIMADFPEMKYYGSPSAIPTTLIIKDGKIVKKMLGLRTYLLFKNAVKRYLEK